MAARRGLKPRPRQPPKRRAEGGLILFAVSGWPQIWRHPSPGNLGASTAGDGGSRGWQWKGRRLWRAISPFASCGLAFGCAGREAIVSWAAPLRMPKADPGGPRMGLLRGASFISWPACSRGSVGCAGQLAMMPAPYPGHLAIKPAPYPGHPAIKPAPCLGHRAIKPAPYLGHLATKPAPYLGHRAIKPAPCLDQLHIVTIVPSWPARHPARPPPTAAAPKPRPQPATKLGPEPHLAPLPSRPSRPLAGDAALTPQYEHHSLHPLRRTGGFVAQPRWDAWCGGQRRCRRG